MKWRDLYADSEDQKEFAGLNGFADVPENERKSGCVVEVGSKVAKGAQFIFKSPLLSAAAFI